MPVGFAVLDCDVFGSAALVVDHLEAVLSFTAAVGFEGSGLLEAAELVAVGFLAAVAVDGRLTSFLTA